MSATPSRVLPGLKMAGHMGAERVKIRKLEVSVMLGRVAVKHFTWKCMSVASRQLMCSVCEAMYSGGDSADREKSIVTCVDVL